MELAAVARRNEIKGHVISALLGGADVVNPADLLRELLRELDAAVDAPTSRAAPLAASLTTAAAAAPEGQAPARDEAAAAATERARAFNRDHIEAKIEETLRGGAALTAAEIMARCSVVDPRMKRVWRTQMGRMQGAAILRYDPREARYSLASEEPAARPAPPTRVPTALPPRPVAHAAGAPQAATSLETKPALAKAVPVSVPPNSRDQTGKDVLLARLREAGGRMEMRELTRGVSRGSAVLLKRAQSTVSMLVRKGLVRREGEHVVIVDGKPAPTPAADDEEEDEEASWEPVWIDGPMGSVPHDVPGAVLLGRAYCSGQQRAGDELLRRFEAMLRKHVRAMVVHRPEIADDIMQEARLGFLDSVEIYFRRGHTGESFVSYCIRGAWAQTCARHRDRLASAIRVPAHLIQSVSTAIRRGDDIAYSDRRTRAAFEAMHCVGSLDAPLGDDDARSMHERLGDSEDSVEQEFASLQYSAAIALELDAVAASMTDIERAVLRERLCPAPGESPKTLLQIGESRGVTREWVRQIELGVVAKLRAHFASWRDP